jgi:hypothetical protein
MTWGLIFKVLLIFIFFAFIFGSNEGAGAALVMVIARYLTLVYVEATFT